MWGARVTYCWFDSVRPSSPDDRIWNGYSSESSEATRSCVRFEADLRLEYILFVNPRESDGKAVAVLLVWPVSLSP